MTEDAIRRARHKVSSAIGSGQLVRPSCCERCGAEDVPMKDGRTSIQAHHHKGYDHPLDVEWLCVQCHRDETPAAFAHRAPAAKVGWDLVDQIRARYRAGESYYRIARELGFNPKTLYQIVTHKSWPEHARPKASSSAMEAQK